MLIPAIAGPMLKAYRRELEADPVWMSVGENLTRAIVVVVPVFMSLRLASPEWRQPVRFRTVPPVDVFGGFGCVSSLSQSSYLDCGCERDQRSDQDAPNWGKSRNRVLSLTHQCLKRWARHSPPARHPTCICLGGVWQRYEHRRLAGRGPGRGGIHALSERFSRPSLEKSKRLRNAWRLAVARPWP